MVCHRRGAESGAGLAEGTSVVGTSEGGATACSAGDDCEELFELGGGLTLPASSDRCGVDGMAAWYQARCDQSRTGLVQIQIEVITKPIDSQP